MGQEQAVWAGRGPSARRPLPWRGRRECGSTCAVCCDTTVPIPRPELAGHHRYHCPLAPLRFSPLPAIGEGRTRPGPKSDSLKCKHGHAHTHEGTHARGRTWMHAACGRLTQLSVGCQGRLPLCDSTFPTCLVLIGASYTSEGRLGSALAPGQSRGRLRYSPCP